MPKLRVGMPPVIPNGKSGSLFDHYGRENIMTSSKDRNITRRDFVRGTTAAIAAVSTGSFSSVYAKDKPRCKAKDAWKMKLATE